MSVILAFVVLVLLNLTIAASKHCDDINNERTQLTDQAVRFMNASGYLTSEARAYCATGDMQHYNNYITEIEQTQTRPTSISKMIELGIGAEGKKLVENMMATSESLIPQEKTAMNLASQGDYINASKAVLSTLYNEDVTTMAKSKIQLTNLINDRTNKEVGELLLVTRAMEFFTFLSVIAVIVLQIISYLIIRQQVIKPIIVVEAEARRIATGDLSHEIELQPDDSEIGMLIDSMQITKWELRKYIQDISDKLSKMANQDLMISLDVDYIGDFAPIKKSLQQIINTLNRSFGNFDSTADQVSTTAKIAAEQANTLAKGSVRQADIIHDISNDISDMTEGVRRIANSAKGASELANAAGAVLSTSNEQLKGMLFAMNEISNASGEIGKIIKTIEDIAFQTNILALNAAVEAARAGVAGKGFAVVADEVRNLATKSANASKVTSQMIEISLSTIQNGAKIAQSASDTFVEVMVNAGKAADAMSEIYTDTQNQVNVIIQIKKGMDQVTRVVDQNSSSAEESAAVSEELAGQAASLHLEVTQFHLDPKIVSI